MLLSYSNHKSVLTIFSYPEVWGIFFNEDKVPVAKNLDT